MYQTSDTFAYHRQQLVKFTENLPVALTQIIQEEQQKELITSLQEACETLDSDTINGWQLAQNWFFCFIGNHPQLTPIVPRDLLWFLGGDCLHFLTDDEISQFQKIEDKVANEGLHWIEAHRQVLSESSLTH